MKEFAIGLIIGVVVFGIIDPSFARSVTHKNETIFDRLENMR